MEEKRYSEAGSVASNTITEIQKRTYSRVYFESD